MAEIVGTSGLEDGEGLMRNEGGPWLTAHKESWSSVVKLQGIAFASNLNDCGSVFFPRTFRKGRP